VVTHGWEQRLFKELDRDKDGYVDFLGFLQATVYGSSALTHQLLQRALPTRTSQEYYAKANSLAKRRSDLMMKRGVDPVSFLDDVKSSLSDAKSSLGDVKSSLGDAKSSLGDAKSSLCDV
jgi:hypothetical protein